MSHRSQADPVVSDTPTSPEPEDPVRRRFITRMTLALGALGTAALLSGPVGMLLDPLIHGRHKTSGDGDAWRRVASAGAFVVGGPPTRVILREDRTDAWMREDGVVLGPVLIERPNVNHFRIFSGICPDMGCSVGYDAPNKDFLCPCHKSTFKLDGELLPHKDGSPNPSPRGLDALAWRVRGGQLEVHWIRYRTGTPQRIPIA